MPTYSYPTKPGANSEYPGVVRKYYDHTRFTDPREHPISRITIHCVAGKWPDKKSGSPSRDRNASWTYAVYENGEVGQFVPEGARPWTSSNSTNDARAITMEVSNTIAADPWPITEAALESVKDICFYICYKYNIPGLQFTNDIRTSNLTCHRWFEYKSCPGDYIFERLPEIAASVNARLRAKGIEIKKYQDPVSDYGKNFRPNLAYMGNVPYAGTCPAVMLEIVTDEIGYFGKTSNANLDVDSAANNGGNYTKYARDLAGAGYYNSVSKQNQRWDIAFVHWCMYKVCDNSGYKSRAHMYMTVDTSYSVAAAKVAFINKGKISSTNPKVGDIVFFATRTMGIVTKVTSSKVSVARGDTKDHKVAVTTYDLKDGKLINKITEIVTTVIYDDEGKGLYAPGQTREVDEVVQFGRPNYEARSGEDGVVYPSSGNPDDYEGDDAYQEALYGYTRLPLDLLDETKLHQYIVTANRDSKNIPFSKFRDKHISGIMLEAGWYFNASHSVHANFKANNFYTMIEEADKADVPYGLWMLGRARTKQEALLEMKELKNCVQVSNPNLGVWIRPVLTQYVSKNDEIVKVYQEELHKMGLKGKIGFYATNEELKLLTWEDHCKTWALWLVNHVKDLDLIDEMLTTEFWELDSSDVKEEVVVDKANLKPTFGVNFNIQGTFGVPLNLDKGTYTTKFYYGATSDDWMEYVMHIPENARENMPLLVFLHGDNHWGNPGSTYNLGPIVNAKTIYGDNFPFIALYPNMRVRSPQDEGYWYTGDNPAILKQLIDAVATAYTVNRSKIIISGHSRGAMGTWHLANKYTTYFSCAIPVSCGYGSVSYSNLAKLPIRAGAGTVGSDEQDYTRHMQYLCSNIRNEGGDAQFITLTGKSHGNADEAMFTEELFLWMFSQ